MKIAGCLLLFILFVACTVDESGSPSSTMTRLGDCRLFGDTVTVSGTVSGMTFDNDELGKNTLRRDERYYLLHDIVVENFPCQISQTPEKDVWGLGIKHLPEIFDDRVQRPQDGTRVRASGILREKARLNRSAPPTRLFPVLEEVSQIEVLETAQNTFPVKLIGEKCASDMECDDNLICDRETSFCSNTPIRVEWSGPWHDLYGSCDTDADCPVNQFCYLEYTWEESGKHPCLLTDPSTPQTYCPRVGNLADFLGGRYVTGKEVCIRGTVMQIVIDNVGETHVQLHVKSPEIYPDTSPSYKDFGASFEISESYKDPLLGERAVTPPTVIGQEIILFGTYRFDNKHGWFEVHPLKAWWPSD